MTGIARIQCVETTGSLRIDDELTHEVRWCLPDLSDLWDNDIRGDDVLIPGIAGVIPMPRRFTSTRYLLHLVITGWVDEDDEPVADPMDQLFTNVEAFRTAFVGTSKELEYTTPTGETWTSIGHGLGVRKDSITKGIWLGNYELLLLKPWTVTP